MCRNLHLIYYKNARTRAKVPQFPARVRDKIAFALLEPNKQRNKERKASKAQMDSDEEILYEEEVLHEEEIDPNAGGIEDNDGNELLFVFNILFLTRLRLCG